MFKAPKHDKQTPMADLPFWHWLAAKGKGAMRQDRKTDLDYVIIYLASVVCLKYYRSESS